MATAVATKKGGVVPQTRRWSVREVAEFLGVSVKTVWRWHLAGKLPKGRKMVGRTVRWDPEAIRRWWERQPAA